MKIFNLEPAADICLSSFAAAAKLLEGSDSYVLCVHKDCLDVAQAVQADYKTRGIEVDIITRDQGNNHEWFVHGHRPSIPPIVGTVFSHVKM